MTDEGERFSIAAVQGVTERLHAELMTAKGSSDPVQIHASLIAAVEGLLLCVKSIASELIKVEVEGIDKASF